MKIIEFYFDLFSLGLSCVQPGSLGIIDNNVPPGVGKVLCIWLEWFARGREFDGKFLINVNSPPHALPTPAPLPAGFKLIGALVWSKFRQLRCWLFVNFFLRDSLELLREPEESRTVHWRKYAKDFLWLADRATCRHFVVNSTISSLSTTRCSTFNTEAALQRSNWHKILRVWCGNEKAHLEWFSCYFFDTFAWTQP